MGTKHEEGHTYEMRQHKKDGKESVTGSLFGGTGRFSAHSDQAGSQDTVRASRTIQTGNFQFARFTFAVTATADPDKSSELHDWLLGAVAEMVAREEAGIRNEERPDVAIEEPEFEVWGRWINVDYGLTIPGPAKYESGKVDIGVREPVPDGIPLEEALPHVLKLTERRIEDGAGKLGPGADADMGI